MVHNKKNKTDVALRSTRNNADLKKKKFTKLRRHVHQGADPILVLLHSLFPLAIGAYLIYRGTRDDLPMSHSFFNYLGFLTGTGAIVLQLTMIARTLVPRCAAKCMNWLLLFVDFIHFFACIVGAIITLVYTGRTHITVAAISLANIVFCVLPAFLAITSLMNASEKSVNQYSMSSESSYASDRAKPVVVIKRISSDIMSDTSHSRYYASR